MATDGQNDLPAENDPDNDKPDETPTNDPPEHHHDDDACRGRYSALEEKVNSLESALNAVVQFKLDSKPTRKPWTHRGGRS